MIFACRFFFFAIVFFVLPFCAAAEDFNAAIHASLQQFVEAKGIKHGIVVGLVDEHGKTVISYGKLDNGTDQEVNGDTLFEIGSVTKTFTGLLLEDMVERGQMKLDDPVSMYLPQSISVPNRNGREITLLQLATHTSGLPTSSITWTPKRADDPRADYTVEKLYDFVSGCKLPRDPGAKYEYSTVGMALLGQAIAVKAGIDYESLVVDRICRPLGMDSTRFTLTPELTERFATGHNPSGYAVSASSWGALAPGAALRSTANDLLNYLSANLSLRPSDLTKSMERTHVAQFHAGQETDTGRDTDIGLAWMISHEPEGDVVQHGGLTDGFIAFVCFDVSRHRGVVVLCNAQDFNVPAIGRALLECEWQSDRRPQEIKNDSQIYDSYVGLYRRVTDTTSEADIGIRREGDRLFSQIVRSNPSPIDKLLFSGTAELLPESETVFFERLTGKVVRFSRDAQRNVVDLALNDGDQSLAYKKISATPPILEKVKLRAAIKLNTALLDAYVGKYEFPPTAAPLMELS